MKAENILIKILLITAVMVGVACLSVSVNNRWKIPNSDLSVLIERSKSQSAKNTYNRTLILEENYSTKNKIPMALENGEYSRANVYRTSDKTYLVKDFWSDYEINTETKILKKLDSVTKTDGGEFVGAFDVNENGGWRFIPLAEKNEIPLGEKKLK
jgi:hypothetical protein